MAEKVEITNERFYIHKGEIHKDDHPERIVHKLSTYYKYFDEEGNPIKKEPEENGIEDIVRP